MISKQHICNSIYASRMYGRRNCCKKTMSIYVLDVEGIKISARTDITFNKSTGNISLAHGLKNRDACFYPTQSRKRSCNDVQCVSRHIEYIRHSIRNSQIRGIRLKQKKISIKFDIDEEAALSSTVRIRINESNGNILISNPLIYKKHEIYTCPRKLE